MCFSSLNQACVFEIAFTLGMCVSGIYLIDVYRILQYTTRNGNAAFNVLVLLEYHFSTVVLSRDWWEIVWLPENLHFKNQPCNRLYPKKTGWNALVRL